LAGRFSNHEGLIQPLLAEYTSLREEIIGDLRSSDAAASAIVALEVGVFAIAYGYGRREVFLAACPALMLLGTYWAVLFLGVGYLGRYCRFIEDRVNQVVGQSLMSYESKYTLGTSFRPSIRFPGVDKDIHNPFSVLIPSLVVGLMVIQLFNISQGALVLSQWGGWGLPVRSLSAAFFASVFLVWLVWLTWEHVQGLKLIDALGESLDRDLASDAT